MRGLRRRLPGPEPGSRARGTKRTWSPRRYRAVTSSTTRIGASLKSWNLRRRRRAAATVRSAASATPAGAPPWDERTQLHPEDGSPEPLCPAPPAPVATLEPPAPTGPLVVPPVVELLLPPVP